MSYCQLNPDGTFLREVYGNVQEWDAKNYCSVDALVKDGLADQFRVVPLLPTAPPAFNPLAQIAIRDGCEQVNGAWQYKWRIDDLSAEQAEANIAASEATRIYSLWTAADAYEKAQISGSATALLVIGVIQGLPVSLAIKGWIKTIWTEYYTRKALGSTDTDFSFAGPMPYTVPDLMAELGE